MRCFIRHPSDIPIDCRITRHNSVRRDRLKNISSGGLCFQTQVALQQGAVIQITIPVREPSFEATGTIVWCRRANSHYDVGVQFTDENTEFAVRMVEQICQIHHYQREILEKEGRAMSKRTLRPNGWRNTPMIFRRSAAAGHRRRPNQVQKAAL